MKRLFILALALLGACSNQTPYTPVGQAWPPGMDTTGVLDTGSDAGPVDTATPPVDAGPADTGAPDAGPIDTGTVDSGPADAGPADVEPTCVDSCQPEGGWRCTVDGKGHQRCGDLDGDGCFEWFDVVPCPATQVCTDGLCAPKCPDQDCTAKGAKKCDKNGKTVTCFDFNGDGCLAWGGAKSCPKGQVCATGFCALSCKDACTTVGAKKCEGKSVASCSDSNKDGCLDWAKTTPCGAAQVCSSGFCTDTCKDECTTKGATKCDAAGVLTCDDYSKDGCLQWGTAVACAKGQICSSGKCATTCKDECTVKGSSTCQLGKVATCGDYDGDGCLQWGSSVPCAKGLVCNEGKCAKTCSDACTVKGAKQCSPAGKVQQCGDFDGDGCLQWGSGVDCAKGTVCSNGACAISCKDACKATGVKQCVPGSKTQWQSCGDVNKDGCLEWGTPQSCGQNLVCAGAGACEKTCKSTCSKVGAKTCIGEAIGTCGDFNKDGCLEWGTPAPCNAAQACNAGKCTAKPPPAKVVINELVYDSAGADTEVFLELRGPVGTPLAGFSLVGVNGKGGVEYATVPVIGKIGADGYFVVAHTKSTGAVAAAADQKHDGVDFQNGADSVVLRFGAQTVDAVGYGIFSASMVFKGEGKPTVDVTSGQSLGRDHLGTDTDNNQVDFQAIAKQTPGAANPKPCAPKTCKALGAVCGPVNDGCGKVLKCGDCPPGKICGADHKCGDKPCEPKTCKALSIACGPASDGCKKTLDCGKCGAGTVCDKGKCVCQPKTCKMLNKFCGAANDGCGKTLACGSCADGKTCSNGQCICTPKTCKGLGVTCGTPPDGCGKKLACGTCSSGKVCGPSGQCNCAPKNCKDLGLSCGPASDGCGKALSCGDCGADKTCNKGQCVCKPKACGELGCGKQNDGCGQTIDCGPCGGQCGLICPAGWQPDSQAVCTGGDNKGINLSYCTVKVGGSITHNGKKPAVSKYCGPNTNSSSAYAQVELKEVTWGYSYKVELRCKDAVKKGFNWSKEIYPGTYKVSVYGTSNYADFPIWGTQVIHAKLDLNKDKAGIVLDFKSVDVSGSITHNGKKPAVSKYCGPNTNSSSAYAQVELKEVTWGYSYKVELRCKDAVKKGFNWSKKIFPGTYKVSVYGTSNYADFPIWGTQVIHPKLDLNQSKGGLVLDFKSVDVSGSITHNGKKPAVSKYCGPNTNSSSAYAQVEFKEVTWGYSYKVELRCKDAVKKGFNWSKKIFPGTYKVSVYGTSNYADFPLWGTQVIHPELDLSTDKAGLVLDFKSVTISGSITHNGKMPSVSKYCGPNTNSSSTYAQVEFKEVTWGYSYKAELRCKDAAKKGFNWTKTIFPGTYKVSVYGTSNYADFPLWGTQVIHPKLDLKADKSGLVLDYKSVTISGSITHNGNKPSVSKYCGPNTNSSSTYAQVELKEVTWGYSYKAELRCKDAAKKGFDWTKTIFPGTYKVSVYGTSNYADFPIWGTQVIHPKLSLPQNKSGIVLDYKSVTVGGAIFANGVTPATSKYCGPNTNSSSTYAQVEWAELTWGYKYTIALRCKDAAKVGFNWSKQIFPGTYKVSVYGTSNYANFPIWGTQVVVPKIQVN